MSLELIKSADTETEIGPFELGPIGRARKCESKLQDGSIVQSW